ncbi:DUF6524 family protein [Falsiroseomonas stagni]|uniref:Uncharacterized protein n=1 Tax=Falsiroseomonas stagni DSM 19981 TaxID=1123062 RepID=A0A1I4FER4_9PROT|nr:DUF6524 family protein [Falsiroseomonas stagni]SFL16414.1 hypothetical protein SAMN02745775_13110 [Falsiroseomonas stagni DSM 19981]
MNARHFDGKAVVARGLLSLAAVFGVYNPSGRSYLHWVFSGFDWIWLKIAVGALLYAILAILWQTTRSVLGRAGVVLVIIFWLAATMAASRFLGPTRFDLTVLSVWGLIAVAAVFTAGLSYPHLHHRLGGIVHTEEVQK